MSQTKKSKICLIFIFALISFFMFGCNKSTPVEDICFDLGESEQIILVVGDTLEMKDYVSITPSYASNRNYTILSFDEEIVKVQNNKLVALKEGNTQIKVVSQDNTLKEDLMTVIVAKEKTILSAPKNLTYDSLTQIISFNTVSNATSYTLKLNGQEIELGNSNVYNLAQYAGDVYDTLLTAQVRANAPTYSSALGTSAYCSAMKVYQAGSVDDVLVKNGILTFKKASAVSLSNIYLNEDELALNSDVESFNLTNLDVKYAGSTIDVLIESVVSDSVKDHNGNDVQYYNTSKEIQVDVLSVPTIRLNSSILTWQNVAHCSEYKINIDGNDIVEVSENYFDLKMLANFDDLISTTSVHNIKVVPKLSSDSEFVAKTTAESFIKVKRLETPTISISGSTIEWSQENMASVYAISLVGGDVNMSTASNSNTLSVKTFGVGNYSVTVQAIAKEMADENDVYYLSSKPKTETFVKKEKISAHITDYKLYITNLGTDTVKVDFDVDVYDDIISGDGSEKIIDLENLVFAPDNHVITLTRLSHNKPINNPDEISVESDEFVVSFTQLEKIKSEDVTISDHTNQVAKTGYNTNAIIKLRTQGDGVDFELETNEYTYNTTDNSPNKNFLKAGVYTTKVYAIGDGSSTFSYRDAGFNVVECLTKEFTVLKVSEIELQDIAVSKLSIKEIANADSYNIIDENGNVANVETLEFPFDLDELKGSVKYSVQTVGDGSTTFDSIVSEEIEIIRLKTPTLTFDSKTNIITKHDDNTAGVKEYVFKQGENVVSYDFASAYTLTEDTTFSLQALAIDGNKETGIYYLNSGVFPLILTKTTNGTDIYLNEVNKLIIEPKTHTERYNIIVVFNFNGTEKEFVSNGDILTDGNTTINYRYNSGKYEISIIDENHNVVLEEFKQEFGVKVKYMRLETASENFIDSEYSDEELLNLVRIDNATEISITEDNKIVIAPKTHNGEYGLVVEFNFNGTKKTFTSNSGVLTDGETELSFIYSSKKYEITIIDSDYNAIIEQFKQEFGVKVKYLGLTSSNVDLFDSEFSNEQKLNLIRIDGETTILINDENQLVITPANHNQDYGLTVVINNGTNLTFVSNGSVLVGDYELPYTYLAGTKSYYVDLLNEDLRPIITELNSNFTVKVKYSYKQNGIQTDLDSDFSATKTIEVLPVATIVRENQTLKFNNVKQTYTYLNYALFINNEYILQLEEDKITTSGGYISFDVSYVYENTPSKHLEDINSVSVIVKNIETSVEKPQLTMKGASIYISKTQTIELITYKHNNNEDGKNNNSAVVQFNTYDTDYDKQYVVEIYTTEENKQVERFVDADATSDLISIYMDEITNLEGVIRVRAYVATTGRHNSTNTIEMFNSNVSNVVSLEKVEKVSGLIVSDSVLKFTASENVVGYEVYEKKTNSYEKLNQQLITTNEYTITNVSGRKEIVVKAISVSGGYTNSIYSDSIVINKIATPTIYVENGKLCADLSVELIELLLNEKIEVLTEITNSQVGVIPVDLNDLDGVDIKLVGTTLVAEPYKFLTYNSQSLIAEDLSMQIRIEQTEATDDVYYLNSDVSQISVYGLKKPVAVSKTTQENDSVELLTWQPSDKNVLNGSSVSVGYVFKIEYSVGENTFTYYSTDEKLKYYDIADKEYKSYPTNIVGTSAVFPVGYGLDEDGKLEVEFGAGVYKVSVQTVSTSVIENYNICNSAYTEPYQFEIMQQTVTSVKDGTIVWEKQDKATKYSVSIYENESLTPVLVDTVTTPVYDFTNATLNHLSGVYRVVVKAISTTEDALNGKESEPIYVYRLPEASEIIVDDGQLILNATKFYTTATIEFVDNTTNTSYVEEYDNSAVANLNLASLGVTKWQGASSSATTKVESLSKTAIKLNSKALTILDGRDYTINVTLKGNSDSLLGCITSTKTMKISNITATKLKPNVSEVSLGVVQFMPDTDYATITNDVFALQDDLDLNYSFNNTVSSTFWHNTIIYKIELTYSKGVIYIYAVDYYSSLTAINNGNIKAAEYEILTGTSNIYASVNYVESETSKTIKFGVYKNNIINLRDFDNLEYYATGEYQVGGENKFETIDVGLTNELKTVNLAEGGSFTLNIYMMGGDSHSSIAHLTSSENSLKTFVRYGVNQLSSSEGKVVFNNLLPIVGGKAIDNPVYKVVVTPMNSANKQVFYVYHSTEEEAQTIAARHDAAGYLNATYVKVETDEEDLTILYMNLTNYIADGVYNVNIRTLAGLGSGDDDADYLLNAKEATVDYTFYKLTDVEFYAENGVLKFEQSYITRNNNKVYGENYEITLTDIESGVSSVYQINRNSDGVKIDDTNHIVAYAIPAQITLENKTISVSGNKNYEIKIRAIASDNYVLNGTYKQEQSVDKTLTFVKSQGLSETAGDDLRVENGILKWKVLDLENHVNTVIKLSFLDENSQVKNLFVTVDDLNKYVLDGEYQYHYYEFTDDKYSLETTGSVYILDDVEYTIGAYVTGKTTATQNILNSNYSSEIKVFRLAQVKNTIKTVDGILTWETVNDACSYDVVISGAKKHEFTIETNSLDVSTLGLDVGTYSVQIRANGSTIINAMKSEIVSGFVKLNIVDKTTIEISGDKITWQAVENAQGYNVRFEYLDATGQSQVETGVVTTNEFTATLANGIDGVFTIYISAVGVGDGKVFNSASVDFTSSKEVPASVSAVEFDSENSRFVITVDDANFFDGDSLKIMADLNKYVINENVTAENPGYSVLSKDITALIETISYQQSGRYEIVDDNTTKYYYPITTMGKYSNISVQVVRSGTLPSNAIVFEDSGQRNYVDFNLFSYGDGTNANPYRIQNSTHLLNINHFVSANYELVSSINMSGVNIASRLEQFGALISSTFSGTIEGNSFSIFGFNKDTTNKTDTISLNDAPNLAFFTTLSGATIKNLTFGEENYQFILLNTFANSVPNVVNLSLIATGANNSIIDNIKVLNMKIQLVSSLSKTSGTLNVAGLVNTMSSTTISNSTINLEINVDMRLSNNVSSYIGGVATNATNSNITATVESGTSITFKVSTRETNLLTYVGGVVAYQTGNTSKTTGIKNTNVNFTMANIKVEYIGGLVGFASYLTIDGCETTGSYSKSSVNYETYVGGLVGYAVSSNIQNSGSLIEFSISLVSSVDYVYVGAIAGVLTVQSSIPCQVLNCYSPVYIDEYQLKSEIDENLNIVIRIHGNDVGSSVTISCKKEK
ncbi:MAG: hypothetical protein J6Q13_00710 [Clostridia bacterium]|nr:hypothetical protein [Clostridia bacterium]